MAKTIYILLGAENKSAAMQFLASGNRSDALAAVASAPESLTQFQLGRFAFERTVKRGERGIPAAPATSIPSIPSIPSTDTDTTEQPTTTEPPSQEGPAGKQSPAGDTDGDDSLSLLPGSGNKKK